MKKKNLKNCFSAFAVLAVSGVTALSTLSLAACTDKGEQRVEERDAAVQISTAVGMAESQSSGSVYYVSPDGKNTNDGSFEKPLDFFSLLSGDALKPGDTVYALPGTYRSGTTLTITASGEYNKYIRIVNAALEKDASGYTGTDTEVVLDFSDQTFASTSRGVQIYGSFIHWYGIDVCGAGDNGLYVGGNYNTVEYCEFYNNRDTGLQLGRAASSLNSIDEWPSYNLVKNCTSHNNYDNETYGENADGFAAKLTVGYGNVFDGCIAYRNSDDGWDLYAKVDSGNIGCVIIYNCVAFENGYIEYTQQENNKQYPTWSGDYTEAENEDGSKNTTGDNRYGKQSYTTRDGDGNGFKLGGSVMEGDVVMVNCLAFNNRMHGVTDNSNPGYLKIDGVTSYNNSAAIDNDPTSPTFGKVLDIANSAEHNNIDLARQTYSYNTVRNTLSVTDAYAKSLGTDAYRGSVTDSVLLGKSAAYYVVGSIDADTNTGENTYTEKKASLVSSDIFAALPFYKTESGVVYNITGLDDLGEWMEADGSYTMKKSETRVHLAYRNDDRSINMGDILAKKEGVDAKLISGAAIGSTLNLTGWDQYVHFYTDDAIDGNASGLNRAKVDRAAEALTINTDGAAVYQDFDVPTKMLDCKIEWASSDTSVLQIGTEKDVSVSQSEYIQAIVYRDATEDKTVTLTATLTCGEETASKTFALTVKQGDPSLGTVGVATQDGQQALNGATIIIDQYTVYREPAVFVKNGLYKDSDKLLTDEYYSVETTYLYAADKNADPIQIMGFTPSHAGVYTITNKVTLETDGSTAEMTYVIYVAASTAQVDFTDGVSNVIVNRDGYIVEGALSSATGYIYSVSSENALADLTADNIKTYAGVEAYEFRAESIRQQFANDNGAGYHIYYALGNLNGDVTSEIYEVEIGYVEIDNADDFIAVAHGEKVGSEDPATTIYSVTECLDFTGKTFGSGSKAFTGLINGNGHTLSNITVNDYVFYKVSGGTVMNVKFDEVSVTATSDKAGIVGETSGGYFHNIAITNIATYGSYKRIAALIGHVGDAVAPLEITNVSVVNDKDHILTGSGRVAGFIGYVQYYYSDILIRDCYVVTDIKADSEMGGMVASWEDGAGDTLTIVNCYYSGTFTFESSARAGGMLGYHKGGAGELYIEGCISLATHVMSGVKLTASVKNGSPILGNFSTAAVVTVKNCIGLMEEYNTDYDVTVYTEQNLKRVEAYAELGFAEENGWTLTYGEDDTLVAPYLELGFLGDWNDTCGNESGATDGSEEATDGSEGAQA